MALKINLPVNQSGVNPNTNESNNPDNEIGNVTPDVNDRSSETSKNTDNSQDNQNQTTNDTNTTTEVVEIDGNEYSIDEKGNALDKDGKVYMSKEELDALDTDESDSNESDSSSEDNEGDEVEVSSKDISKLSGIILKDNDGNELEFDLTPEGLAKREKMIKEMTLKEGTNAALNSFFKNNPDLYKAYIHKQKTGSLEGFSSQPFYKSMQLNKDDEQQMTQLIVEAELKRGRTPEQAKKYAQFAKVENQLDVEGEAAHKYLTELEDKEFNSYEETKTNAKKQQIEYESKFYGNYYDENNKEVIVDTPGSIYNKIVTQGKFGNLVIPEDGITVKRDNREVKLNRRQLFDYVATPIDNQGRSQAQIDMDNKLQNPDYLLQQYMQNLTGNNLDVFIKRAILEEKGKRIKARFKTKTGSAGNKPSNVGRSNKKIITPV